MAKLYDQFGSTIVRMCSELFDSGKYSEAIKKSNDLIEAFNEVIADSPKAGISYGSYLVRLYEIRARSFYGLAMQLATNEPLAALALLDVEKALSLPDAYFKADPSRSQLQELREEIYKVLGTENAKRILTDKSKELGAAASPTQSGPLTQNLESGKVGPQTSKSKGQRNQRITFDKDERQSRSRSSMVWGGLAVLGGILELPAGVPLIILGLFLFFEGLYLRRSTTKKSFLVDSISFSIIGGWNILTACAALGLVAAGFVNGLTGILWGILGIFQLTRGLAGVRAYQRGMVDFPTDMPSPVPDWQCPQCSLEIPSGAIVCGFCGYHFSEADIQTVQQKAAEEQARAVRQAAQEQAEARTAKLIKRGKSLRMSGGLIAAIGAVILTMFVVINFTSPPTENVGIITIIIVSTPFILLGGGLFAWGFFSLRKIKEEKEKLKPAQTFGA